MNLSTTIIVLMIAVSTVTASVMLYKAVATVRSNNEQLRRQKAVLADGIPAKAVVNSIRQTSSSLGGQPIVLLDLIVTKQDGTNFRTVVRTAIPIVHIPDFQKGCIIDVKYVTTEHEIQVEAEGAYAP